MGGSSITEEDQPAQMSHSSKMPDTLFSWCWCVFFFQPLVDFALQIFWVCSLGCLLQRSASNFFCSHRNHQLKLKVRGLNLEASKWWCKFLTSKSAQPCEIWWCFSKDSPALSENKVHYFFWEWHVFILCLIHWGKLLLLPWHDCEFEIIKKVPAMWEQICKIHMLRGKQSQCSKKRRVRPAKWT